MIIKMLRLLWLLAAVEMMGISRNLGDWKTLLGTIDGSLPLTTAANSKICYYFDVAQTCSADAIGDLLSEAAVDLATWVPTQAQCDSLLDEQRLYAEEVAGSVFSAAIASAATASVTDFDLLAQSWVLRVGHYPLTVDHAAFVTALNSITDWATVHCDGANLAYDSTTIAKPDFVGAADCGILDNAYTPPLDCSDRYCTYDGGAKCCLTDFSSACCTQQYYPVINIVCIHTDCGYLTFCRQFASESLCCTG
jgi:hypothetical protein